MLRPPAHLPDDHQAGMNADPYSQTNRILTLKLQLEPLDSLNDAQCRITSALRIVIMRVGIVRLS
jgi:hypothetical protein